MAVKKKKRSQSIKEKSEDNKQSSVTSDASSAALVENENVTKTEIPASDNDPSEPNENETLPESSENGEKDGEENDEKSLVDETKKKKPDEKPLSKRARWKIVNNKQKWPQQPRTKSPEARAKAYIRAAGLTHPSRRPMVQPDEDLHSPSVRFCRLLGSPDYRTRHQAVLHLKSYLKARCSMNMDGNDGGDTGDDEGGDKSEVEGGLSEMDLLKLWKGLWHTLYMADRVPVQNELSRHLSELIWCVAGTPEEDEYAAQAYLDAFGDDEDDMIDAYEDYDGMEDDGDGDENDDGDGDDDDEEGAYEEMEDNAENEIELGMAEMIEEDEEGVFDEDEEMEETEEDTTNLKHCRGAHLAALMVRTLFRTLHREWGHMDKYRLDKFYALIRMVVHQIYKYMSVRHWNLGIIQLFNDALYDEVLSQIPNGLRYHLIDITMDELSAVHAEAPMPLTEATFVDCIQPYFAMAQTGAGGDDSIHTRVVEKILQRFLYQHSVVSDVAISNDDEEALKKVLDQVHVGTVADFIFTLASDSETNDKYRKTLFDLYKSYMKRIKKAGKDVVLENPDDEREQVDEEETEDDVGEESEQLDQNDDGGAGEKEGGEEKRDVAKHKDRKPGFSQSGKSSTTEESNSTIKKALTNNEAKESQDAENTNKQTRKRKMAVEETEPQSETQAEELDGERDELNSKKKKKKKKKKRKKSIEEPEEKTTTEIKPKIDELSNEKEERVKEEEPNKSSASSKAKAKPKEETEPSEITISVEDQKRAKKALERKDQDRKNQDKVNQTSGNRSTPVGKKVSFDSVNHARSYKVSMKKLKTASPTTPPADPNKSILLKKKAAGSKKNRLAKDKNGEKRRMKS